jgi:hypothetical protein
VGDYLNKVIEAKKAGTPDAELVDTVAKAFAAVVNRVAPELTKLEELQKLAQ